MSPASLECTSTSACLIQHADILSKLRFDPWRSMFTELRLDSIISARDPTVTQSSPRVPTQWCPHNAAYEFIPATAAVIPGTARATTNWTGADSCFAGLSATIEVLTTAMVRVRVTGNAPTGSCDALYAIGTSFHMRTLELTTAKPTAAVELNISSANERDDVTINGLTVFLLPCGTSGTLASIAKTAGLWIGSANETVAANVELLTYRGVWPSPMVPFGQALSIDASLVPSGTYLSIMEVCA
jgi:hypothetical protein